MAVVPVVHKVRLEVLALARGAARPPPIHSMQLSMQQLPLLLVAAVANARVVGGKAVPHIPSVASAAPRVRRRRQMPGLIFSSALPGFNPMEQPELWPHVWRAPSSQAGPNKKKRYVYEADIESSLRPGSFHRVRVEYPRRGDAQVLPGYPSNAQLFKPIVRTAVSNARAPQSRVDAVSSALARGFMVRRFMVCVDSWCGSARRRTTCAG